jgi:class 3 adenylate cyclase
MTDELIAELVELAGNLAALVVGLPDEMMETSLAGFRDTLESEMAGLGADIAKQIADAFMMTIGKVKRELETAAGGQMGVTLQ